MPPRCAARWSEAEISKSAENALADVFVRLWALEPELDDSDQPRPRMLRLTPKAKRVWTAYFDRHAEEQVELDGDLAAAWSKLRGAAARLALILHLAGWAPGGEEEPERIDQASVEAGIGLTDWFGNEARRVYGLLCESDEEREERELTSWIDGKGGRATVRDMMRGLRRYRNDAPAIEKALARLVKRQRGRWVSENRRGGPGRPKSILRASSRW